MPVPLGGPLGAREPYSVGSRGPMTNGAASCQRNGHKGASIKFAASNGLIVDCVAGDWVCLYILDGTAEIRDARQLTKKGVGILRRENPFPRP